MALGGMSALATAPAFADEIGADQSEVAVEEETAQAPPDTPADTPSEEPAVEEPAVEEPVVEPPTEPVAETPAETPAEGEVPVDDAEEAAEPPTDDAAEAQEEKAASDEVQLLLVPPGEEVVDKVEICHGTASYKNPYIINEPAASGDVSGHADHVGPIFYPEIPKGTAWGDIIPPFYYDDGSSAPAYFPGLNWTAEGAAIYENDCAAPSVPDPSFEYWVDSCVTEDGEGYFEWELSNLVSGLVYAVEIYGADGTFVVGWLVEDTEGVASAWRYLPPGDYAVEILVYNDSVEAWEVFEVVEFTVDVCLDVNAVATGCSLGYDGSALVSLSGLRPGEEYTWVLVGDDYEVSGILGEEVTGDSLDVPFGDLPPGNYVFAIWLDAEEGEFAESSFFIEPCPPDVTVVVTECTASGQDGAATVKLHNLVEGVEYEVWVQDADGVVHGEPMIVVGDSTHMGEVDISSLPAGRSYTAWVYGEWMAPEGGSEWGPVESFALEASADFSLKACPPAPGPAALAATGIDGTGGLVAAALIFFGLGGAALIARSRRQEGSRISE